MNTLYQTMTRQAKCSLIFVLFLLFAAGGGAQELTSPPLAKTNGDVEEAPGDLVEESDPLTFSDVLSLALRQSPVLAAFSWDIRAADAMIVQAGLRPNPELAVSVEEVRWTSGPAERTRVSRLSAAPEAGIISIPGMNGKPPTDLSVIRANPAAAWEWEKVQGGRSGFSESELTISIAQPIQLGKKRAKRMAVAEREKELILWDYQTARADVLAQTASNFVEVLAAQERVILDEELVELAEEIVRTFSLRVKAGQVSPLELSRAEVALATTQAALEERRRELESARAVLASNWGSKRAAFVRAVGRLDEISPIPPLEELLAQLTHNPDVARWSSELAARRANFTLEQAQRLPDLTFELGFRSTGMAARKATQYGFDSGGDFGFSRSETGYSAERDNSLMFGFSLPLPLFDRNQGKIAAAEAMIAKAGEQRRGAEAAAHAELTSAYQIASGAYAKVRTLQDDVMPKVAETFTKIQRGYQQGKFSYLEVLDTQRTLFEVREAFLDALTRYHQGIVRMERLTGQALGEYGQKDELKKEEVNHAE